MSTMVKNQLKAYAVRDITDEEGNVDIVYAENASQAKLKFDSVTNWSSGEYINLRANRFKEVDKYQNKDSIPTMVLLKLHWWFGCRSKYPCTTEIRLKNILNKTAKLVKGTPICIKCYEKMIKEEEKTIKGGKNERFNNCN